MCGLLLLLTQESKAVDRVDLILSQVYGTIKTGCTQTSVTTTGNNRSGPYATGRRYVIYGYNGSTNAGDTLKCVTGGSTVDVTALAGSKLGKIIYANQQEVWYLQDGNAYVSCISTTASMKYDVCPLD